MILRTGNKGFTLVEVMIASAILAVGMVAVNQMMIRSAGIISRYVDTLKVDRWANEAMWNAKAGLFYAGAPSEEGDSGVFTDAGRQYGWRLEKNPAGGAKDTYRLALRVSWQEGDRPVEWVKSAYVSK